MAIEAHICPRCKGSFEHATNGWRRIYCRSCSIEARRETEARSEARRKAKRAIKTAERMAAKPWLNRDLPVPERRRLRRQIDPSLKLQRQIHKKHRKDWLRAKIRGGAVGGRRSQRFPRKLGYTAEQLRAHLERQFTKGMNWERFAAGEIEIDHIVPMSAFDLTDDGGIKAAWALTNLRPLWAKDNRAKAARRTFLI